MGKLAALALGALAVTAGVSWSRSNGEEPQQAILPRPFTADQIRDEFVPGLTIELLRHTPAGESRDRWTVVAADAEGVAIESAVLDAEDKPVGELKVERSAWVELRDHATFPADRSTREEVTRDTPLGRLAGWLYTVRDPGAGTVSEFFFATFLPGAPVEMRVTKGGETVFEMVQRVRRRPPR